jgi:hypothetical protein
LIGSSDKLHVFQKDADTNTSANLDTAVKFLRIMATYERRLGKDMKLTLSPAWGQDSVTFAGAQAADSGPFTSLTLGNKSFSYRMRAHGKLRPTIALDTGVDLLSRVTKFDALVPVDDTLISSAGVDIEPSKLLRGTSTLGLAAYASVGIDVTSRLKLIPGLRGDGYFINGEERSSIDPRMLVRYKTAPQWTVKGYIGKYTQPPQPEALDSRFGNPNVGLENGYHFGLGYEWKPERLWSIDSEIYYVDRRDVVVFSPEVIDNGDGSFSYENFTNEGRRASYGFEAIIKREISERAFGWLSYTYSHSRQTNRRGENWFPTGFDQPHVLNAVASFKPGAGFELGARFQLASGRPDAVVVGSTFDADCGCYDSVVSGNRATRVPTYIQLDVRAEKVWLFELWSIGAYLDVINVTNRKNQEGVDYDYRFRESAPITSFPIFPTVGVRGQW